MRQPLSKLWLHDFLFQRFRINYKQIFLFKNPKPPVLIKTKEPGQFSRGCWFNLCILSQFVFKLDGIKTVLWGPGIGIFLFDLNGKYTIGSEIQNTWSDLIWFDPIKFCRPLLRAIMALVVTVFNIHPLGRSMYRGIPECIYSNKIKLHYL